MVAQSPETPHRFVQTPMGPAAPTARGWTNVGRFAQFSNMPPVVATVMENQGSITLTGTINGVGTPPAVSSFQVTTEDGSAKAGTDYVPLTTTVNCQYYSCSSFTITILNDGKDDEANPPVNFVLHQYNCVNLCCGWYLLSRRSNGATRRSDNKCEEPYGRFSIRARASRLQRPERLKKSLSSLHKSLRLAVDGEPQRTFQNVAEDEARVPVGRRSRAPTAVTSTRIASIPSFGPVRACLASSRTGGRVPVCPAA
jgi:hypothetical protein